MELRRLYILTLTLLFNLNLSALDIYIAPSGNDQNPGTKNAPLASLKGARDLIRQLRSSGKLNEEIRVLVANGIYFMTEPLVLTDQDSGSENFPVIFMAETGAAPVFIGGIPIKNWERVNNDLWKAKVPEVSRYGFYFEQLYVNDQRATRAKSPNQGFYFLKEVEETIIAKGKEPTQGLAAQKLKIFRDANGVISKFSQPDLEDAVLTLYHKWDNTRKRISEFSAESSTVILTGKPMQPWNQMDRQTRFTIENYKAAIDTVNEWYLDRNGELFFIPKPGENPNEMDIYAPVTERFITLQGNEQTGKNVAHIRFENLRFRVSGYRMPITGNEAAQAASPVDATIMADFANHKSFVNCEVSQTGTSAFWFRKGCSNCMVQQCYLHELGAGGVKIGDIPIPDHEKNLTKRIRIDNNIIRSGGYVFPCAVGVTIFQASDNNITHNEIANFRYSGVSIGWVWGYTPSPSKRNIIEFNHIHHLGWGELCDMGGVYCLGQSEGTSVSNNLIHHVYSFDYGGWGLYTDEGSTGIIMENNLVYSCKNSGFHQHYGKENTIRNNIFAANIKGQLQATKVEEHLSFNFTNNIVWFNSGSLLTSQWSKVRINSDNNCYWDTRTKDIRFDKLSFTEWQASGKDTKSVVEDPKFVNPLQHDFRIQNKSMLKKIGFKPFDYTKAGVYGDEKWKKLAEFDPALAKAYDEAVEKLEKRTP
jgi:parallel beta-helix repeat protein